MNITIIGGGNIGTQFAVHCAQKHHQVKIYTSKPDRFDRHLLIVDEERNVIREGDIVSATDNEAKAFSDAELIFVTVPAFCMKDVENKIYPFVRRGVKIGLIPGTGGSEWAFRKVIEKGAVIFGMQRVPSVARLVEYGKSVCAVGYRKELHVAALPHVYTDEIAQMISEMFDMPCAALPNYLNLTLIPSNPILHTTRLRTIFKDYHVGLTYDILPLFYENWNDEASELLLKCDDELRNICSALTDFDLSYVKSLKIHYESETPKQLTAKISSIESLKGLKTPSVETNGKYIPDFNSRYFTADFTFGLGILVQIADLMGVKVPNMKETLEWYTRIVSVQDAFRFTDYGVKCKNDFLSLYKQ